MNRQYIHIQRRPYEEPHLLQLEISASNGQFSGATDIYCDADELGEIGRALRIFPTRIGDEYVYTYGSDDPAERAYRLLVLRAYTTDCLGHSALQIAVNTNSKEPEEGLCRFSIPAEPAAINRLGEAIEKFKELKHLELRWSPHETELFDQYQR